MDKLLGDVQKLKHGQMIAEDLGYGSMATGIIALVCMIYLVIRLKMASKASRGALVRNKMKPLECCEPLMFPSKYLHL